MDFIDFLKKLKPEDWEKPVTDKWSVKDVVAHLVGWEKESVRELKRIWGTDQVAWFVKDTNYKDFNDKTVAEFSHYSPNELFGEWEKWQAELDSLVEKIGEDKIRQAPDMDWVFDEGEDGHCLYHYKQIENCLKS